MTYRCTILQKGVQMMWIRLLYSRDDYSNIVTHANDASCFLVLGRKVLSYIYACVEFGVRCLAGDVDQA